MLKRFINRIRSNQGKQTSKDWNLIIDQVIRVAGVEALTDFCHITSINFNKQVFWNWVKRSHTSFAKKRYPDKKALEFFFSTKPPITNISESHSCGKNEAVFQPGQVLLRVVSPTQKGAVKTSDYRNRIEDISHIQQEIS